MLQLSSLYSGYGKMVVVVDFNLDIADGEILALVGRNGAGKTTLMRTIMGLIKVKQGQILLDGVDIKNLRPDARVKMGLGYVPQGRQIFPKLSVLDNLKVGARGHYDRIPELLEKYPVLKSRLRTKGAALSGGEQQILAFARVLVARPSILLVDEPSEGIQPSILDVMLEDLQRVNQEDGTTILLAEQNLAFAMELAHRAVLMGKGRIVRELPPQQLMEDKDIQQEYFGV